MGLTQGDVVNQFVCFVSEVEKGLLSNVAFARLSSRPLQWMTGLSCIKLMSFHYAEKPT